jgi:CBS domain-containing protein/sporulation protein YlmC with PRC-barrel domain
MKINKVQVMGEFFFSQIQGLPIFDHEGLQVGRLRDLAIRWEQETPKVTGLKFAKHVQQHIPVEQVEEVSRLGIELKGPLKTEELIPLQPDEIYMGKWLMDKQIIDLKGSKIVRVNDIKLFWLQADNRKYIVPAAVDIGLRGLARRLGVEFLFKRRKEHFVWWEFIQHLEEKTANLKLLGDRKQLDKLHPADLAEIIEDLDYKKRTDFIEELDTETAAEAIAEMELDTQVEILEHLDSRQASNLLEEMPPDEAADLLGELPEERSDELLNLMEPEEAQEVRELMDYEEGTAGALMTPEFIALPPHLTAAEAIVELRRLAAEAETIYYIYIVGDNETLAGVVSLRELLMAEPETQLQEFMQTRLIFVRAQETHGRVAELLNKYSLLAIPVVSAENQMLGIITVDDVLELLVPDRGSLETFANFFISKRTARG